MSQEDQGTAAEGKEKAVERRQLWEHQMAAGRREDRCSRRTAVGRRQDGCEEKRRRLQQKKK